MSKDYTEQKPTEEQMEYFLRIAKERKLDPDLKQIYPIMRAGKLTIQTGIDGFRIIAERTGKYSPGKDTKFLFDKNNNLFGATVYVKKCTFDGTWHDVSATAYLHEYCGSSKIWRQMPSVMIEKCAESRALRRAFPEAFSGIYSDDEMDQAVEPDKHIEVLPNKVSAEEIKGLEEILSDSASYQALIMKNLKDKLNIDSLEGISREVYDKILPVALKKQSERQQKTLGNMYGEQQQIAVGG